MIGMIDFIINCLVEDSTNPVLDGMGLVVLGHRAGIAGHLDRITPTSWKYHPIIQL